MADTNESIADIVAEKRRMAELIRDKLSTVLVPKWHQQAVKSWEDEADRLDRARMKMEVEMANLRKANAKLREALEELVANIDMRSPTFGLNVMVDTKTYLDAKTALTTTSNQYTQVAKKIQGGN